jgi:hypothetical protein
MPEGISGFWVKITTRVRSSKADAGLLTVRMKS